MFAIVKNAKFWLFIELFFIITSFIGFILYKFMDNVSLGQPILIYTLLGLATLYSINGILPPPANRRMKGGHLAGSYLLNLLVHISLSLGVMGILFALMQWNYYKEIVMYAGIGMLVALVLIWLLRPVNDNQVGDIDWDRIRLSIALFISAFFLY